jgi:hypothetical protein
MLIHFYKVPQRPRTDLELPAELEERLNILSQVVELLGIDDVSFARWDLKSGLYIYQKTHRKK